MFLVKIVWMIFKLIMPFKIGGEEIHLSNVTEQETIDFFKVPIEIQKKCLMSAEDLGVLSKQETDAFINNYTEDG